MASQKSKRRSRKRRDRGPAPPAARAPRRELQREARVERQLVAEREHRRVGSSLGTYGERPPSPFGGVPVSELAIFAGAIAVVVGVLNSGGPALIVGIVVCTLGVVEFTAREHFSGYRSHATLLAAIPAVIAGVVLLEILGEKNHRGVLVVVVPVFAVLFWLLRKRFNTARQGRVARPPAP